jgi:predicted nucleotidyltransferase
VDLTVEFLGPEEKTAQAVLELRSGLVEIFGREVDLAEVSVMPDIRHKREIARTVRVIYDRDG